LLIEGTTADAVIAHLRQRWPELREESERCVYEYATSNELTPRTAIADLEHAGRSWTEVRDSDFGGVLLKDLVPDRVPDLPLGPKAFAYYASTTTDSYRFFYYEAGKLRRALARNEGRVVTSFGDALAEEAELPDAMDELAFLRLAHRLGIGSLRIPIADIDKQGYRMIDRAALGGVIPGWATAGRAAVPRSGELPQLTHDEEAALRRAFGIPDIQSPSPKKRVAKPHTAKRPATKKPRTRKRPTKKQAAKKPAAKKSATKKAVTKSSRSGRAGRTHR
jgi:hypothetical protein